MSVNGNSSLNIYKSNVVHNPVELSGTNCFVSPSVSLSTYTSYRVGGNAEWYVEPESSNDIQAVFEWLDKRQMPLTCLGKGSNMLVSDRGIDGLVVNTRNLSHCEFKPEDMSVTVGAGYSLPKLTWKLAKRGWQGLEWAVGIPGSIGGAVVMNAGAHTGCIADVLVSAKVAYPDGRLVVLSPEELEYSYRTSALQNQQVVVVEATFKMKNFLGKEKMMALNSEHFNHRKTTQPYGKPSCGSVFRNPKPKAAGWLIEQIGLKGYQIGDAQVSHCHANFILNCGKATASDIFRLINHVQEQVQHHWAIALHPEVKFLGTF